MAGELMDYQREIAQRVAESMYPVVLKGIMDGGSPEVIEMRSAARSALTAGIVFVQELERHDGYKIDWGVADGR